MIDLSLNGVDFYKTIPTDVLENLSFRVKLHTKLTSDEKLQNRFFDVFFHDQPPHSCKYSIYSLVIGSSRNDRHIGSVH